jgi:hypothetical protein
VTHPVIGRLGPAAMALSMSVLGILVYGPDLLMSGPASVDAVRAEHAAPRRPRGALLTLRWNEGLEQERKTS